MAAAARERGLEAGEGAGETIVISLGPSSPVYTNTEHVPSKPEWTLSHPSIHLLTAQTNTAQHQGSHLPGAHHDPHSITVLRYVQMLITVFYTLLVKLLCSSMKTFCGHGEVSRFTIAFSSSNLHKSQSLQPPKSSYCSSSHSSSAPFSSFRLVWFCWFFFFP